MISDLLAAHLQALHEVGHQAAPVRPGPDEETVRSTLSAAGHEPRPELVDFFSWAVYGVEGRTLSLFWETPDPLSVDQAVSYDPNLLEWLRGDPSDPSGEWPGPVRGLPIIHLDGLSEFVSIDTVSDHESGGSIWFSAPSTPNVRMFDSLADALAAATYCVQAGLWTVADDGWTILCERDSVPGPEDVDSPPWA